MLASHTCVSLRYGPTMSSRGGFSWPRCRRTSGSNAVGLAARGRLSPRSRLVAASSCRSTFTRGWRNINRLSIGYAFRPRLRSRLTLGGFTFPRKPWAFGGRDSHPSYRYSFRHTHLHALHRLVAGAGFDCGVRRSPTTRLARIRDCGATLSPRHFRRGMARPVSCYALLKWWLLLSQHPGCHGDPTSFVALSATWGP